MAAINQRRDASEPRNARPETPSDPQASVGDTPTLSISREKVCYIIFKAREFDVKDLPTFPDDGSNPADEGERPVLEDHPDDPVAKELAAFISALNFDEQVDLVTLTWIGRGDGTIADWTELRDVACSEHNRWTARYLLGTPLLGDYLAEGLAQFGYSCEEIADEHLTV
jgi:Protein of unknown function (DUF3775)